MRNHYQEMLDTQYKDGYKNEDSWLELKPNRVHNTAGWKFRISSHPEDTQQAWNIVVEELKKEGDAYRAKVALPHVIEEFSHPEDAQAGKMITIYTEKGVSSDAYKDMMFRIEQKLQEEGIRSGVDVQGDRKISGSSYMSYRNDRNDKGEYQDAEGIAESGSKQAHNPFGAHDPYENFDVQSYNAEIPKLKSKIVNPALSIDEVDVSTKILKATGAVATELKDDGSVGILVAQTYSRDNLKTVGIENTSSLSRLRFNQNFDEIIIPKEQVDKFKVNPAEKKPKVTIGSLVEAFTKAISQVISKKTENTNKVEKKKSQSLKQ